MTRLLAKFSISLVLVFASALTAYYVMGKNINCTQAKIYSLSGSLDPKLVNLCEMHNNNRIFMYVNQY